MHINQLQAPISVEVNTQYLHYHQVAIEQCRRLQDIPKMPICVMHHIGTTAIPHAIGRQVVDILIGLPTLHDVTNLDEKRMNYEGYYRIHRHLTKKLLYAKFDDFYQLNHSHQLHIVEYNSETYQQYLDFHQLMCEHEHYRQMYQQEKIKLAQQFNQHFNKYNLEKQRVIQTILQQAKERHNNE